MIEWDISVHFGTKNHILHCVVEYASVQVIRIRVQGSKSTLLLENNYSKLRYANSKRGVQWKIKEGQISYTENNSSQLLMDIFSNLEYLIKRDFKLIFPDYIGY